MRLASLLALALVLSCVADSNANAGGNDIPCKTGQTAPPIGAWTWAENSHVEIYVRIPDFAADEVLYMLTAIQNWDASHGENGSGVRFEYKGTVSEGRTCGNCLTIVRGKNADKRHGAELRAFTRRNDHVIDYAWIVIDPSYTQPRILTSIVAHELGHSLGLLDCFECNRGSTAMGHFNTTVKLLSIKIADLSNAINGPTACDVKQVREAYKELIKSARSSAPVPSVQVVDEGEEPEEDDTPIVVP